MAGTRRVSSGGRVAAVVVVVMLVTTALAWGLFVYNPAPPDPERPAFLSAPDEPLPAPTDTEAYQVTATLQSNYPAIDETQVVRTKVYYPDEEPVVMDTELATGDGPVVRQVSYLRGDREYVMATFNDASAFEQQVTDESVAQADRSSLTYYAVERPREVTPGIEPRGAIEGLYMLRYEQVGETTYQGRDVIRYDAVDGWTTTEALGEGGDDAQSIYVRQAQGEVLVDASTGAILQADVTGSFIPADSWADVMTAESYSLTVTYEVDTTVDQPNEPPWVESLDDENETATDGGEVRGPDRSAMD